MIELRYFPVRSIVSPLRTQYTVKANGVDVGYIRKQGGHWLAGNGRGGWEGPFPTRRGASMKVISEWSVNEAGLYGGTPAVRLHELVSIGKGVSYG